MHGTLVGDSQALPNTFRTSTSQNQEIMTIHFSNIFHPTAN